MKNVQGANFRSHEIDLEYNVTSCWLDSRTMVFDLLVEEKITIMSPSPFGIRTRQLGLSFAMVKLL